MFDNIYDFDSLICQISFRGDYSKCAGHPSSVRFRLRPDSELANLTPLPVRSRLGVRVSEPARVCFGAGGAKRSPACGPRSRCAGPHAPENGAPGRWRYSEGSGWREYRQGVPEAAGPLDMARAIAADGPAGRPGSRTSPGSLRRRARKTGPVPVTPTRPGGPAGAGSGAAPRRPAPRRPKSRCTWGAAPRP